jgi:hypothetical protein
MVSIRNPNLPHTRINRQPTQNKKPNPTQKQLKSRAYNFPYERKHPTIENYPSKPPKFSIISPWVVLTYQLTQNNAMASLILSLDQNNKYRPFRIKHGYPHARTQYLQGLNLLFIL